MARRFSSVRRMRGEDGSSLLLALAFLTLFGVMIPALLTFGDTNLRATHALNGQRSTTYAADGATDGAIQYLRTHPTCGRPFTVCPVANFTATLNGRAATVSFTALGGALDFDRTVRLVATVEGSPRVEAMVVIRDSSPLAEPPVDVSSWRYHR